MSESNSPWKYVIKHFKELIKDPKTGKLIEKAKKKK